MSLFLKWRKSPMTEAGSFLVLLKSSIPLRPVASHKESCAGEHPNHSHPFLLNSDPPWLESQCSRKAWTSWQNSI